MSTKREGDQPQHERADLSRELDRARDELKAARAELHAADVAHAQLRRIVATIPYPIFATNKELVYTVCNAAFERYLGLSAPEVIGKSICDIAAKTKADAYYAADLALLRTGGTQTYEAKVRYRDGPDHDVIFHKAVLPDGRGGVDGMYGFIYDITELRRAEAERSKLEEQLLHAQKMQTLGQLAGGVAHDLNNLLTPILGYSTLLSGELAAEDPRSAHISAILRAAEHARDLVRQLLAFGRREALFLQPVDMRAVVSDFADILRRTIREDIRLEIALPDTPAPVRADMGQIDQVLMNLAVNAQDAMPDGGVLRVAVHEAEFDAACAAEHPSVVPGAYVLLSASDTGCGIPPSIVEKIFEPFFTTKDVDKGAGLGLSTAYGIVKQHGGHVFVESAVGSGSNFKVYLPKAATLEVPVASDSTGPHEHVLGTETILVVDDDDGVRSLACHVLESLGYRVLAADTVEGACIIVEIKLQPVELLLTDVVMPGANGKQLFDRLRLSLPDLKVVYMSGYDPSEITHHGVLADGVHFVQKPFEVRTLAAKVREALGRGEHTPQRPSA